MPQTGIQTDQPATRLVLGMALAVSLLAGIATNVPAATPGGSWIMVFNDEFDTVDPRNAQGMNPDKWSWGRLPWGPQYHNSEYASHITAEDSYVTGGSLWLKCRKSGKQVGDAWIPWTEGFVHTNQKFRHTYGYVEIRAKFASHAGTWPAFWSLSDGWPPEIDIAEPFGSDYRVHHGLATGADWQSVQWDSTNTSASGIWNWNTWGLEWGPAYLKFYKNGAVVHQVSGSHIPQRSMYYILNSGMRWSYDSSTPDGHAHEFDYIRVYQRSEQLINPGFESYENYGGWVAPPWAQEGSAGPSNLAGAYSSGAAGFRLIGQSGLRAVCQQDVRGLLPNTPYTFTGMAKSSTGNPWVKLGVFDQGNPHSYKLHQSAAFSRFNHFFSTGPSSTAGKIYAQVDADAGTAYIDDMEILRSGVVNDNGFERGSGEPWYGYGDRSIPMLTDSRSGDYLLRFEKSATAKGAEQTVYGLESSTTYRLSAWLKTHNEELQLGVKNHGNPEAATALRGWNWVWTKLTREFTTGPAATSARIYAWTPSTPNNPLYVDDFLLVSTHTAPWSSGDVGSNGIGGESGRLPGGRILIRASGDNVFGTADTFHRVYQPLRGDGNVTARLASFEARQNVAKAGVMIRAFGQTDAAHMMVHWLPLGRVEMITRPNTGAISSWAWSSAEVPWPPHLRLVRTGDTITAFYSTDGVQWIQVGIPQSITLPTTAQAGLAVTAHDATDVAEAVFSSAQVTALDSDLDGLTDAWETARLGTLSFDADDDPAKKGHALWVDQRLGLDPRDGTDLFIAEARRGSNGITLTWPSAPGITFIVEASGQLDGGWTSIATVPAPTAGMIATFTEPASQLAGKTRRFYRVLLPQ